jgi:hypothetical protein
MKHPVYINPDVQIYHKTIYKFDLYVLCVRTLRNIYMMFDEQRNHNIKEESICACARYRY